MAHSFIDYKALGNRIKALEAELASLLHIQSFLGTPAKRGRKPNTKKATTSKVKKARKSKGKTGTLKAAVLAYLKPGPQPIKSIVVATKGNYGSVFQTVNNLVKEKRVAKPSKRGGAYTLIK